MFCLPLCAFAQDVTQTQPEETNEELMKVEDANSIVVPQFELVDDEVWVEPYDGYEYYEAESIDDNGNSELELVADSTEARLPNPQYRIESVRVIGNRENSQDNILKMLDLSDAMTMDELEEARIHLAMSGLFESVDMKLRPSHERGGIDVELRVVERSHIQFNNYFIGSSEKSPFSLGLDVTWLAPFATNHRFRMAYGATTSNDYTLSLNYLIPTIARMPFSLMFSIQSLHSHEDVFGPSYFRSDFPKPSEQADAPDPFDYLDSLVFERHGASVGLGYAPLSNVRLMFRLEYMNLLRENDELQVQDELDDFMRSGHSNLTAAELNVAYDTRAGRQLPNHGHFVMLDLKGTAKTSASDYSYFKMQLAHQSNFRVAPQHIIRLNTFGGFVVGDAPFFEKFFFNDFYSMAPARFYMLNPSSRGALDLFKTGASGLGYEDFLVHLALSYAWQPKERQIEVFVTAAATWADSLNTTNVMLGVQPRQMRDSFPADVSMNVGVKFKTNYGLFSITLSNVLDLVVR